MCGTRQVRPFKDVFTFLEPSFSSFQTENRSSFDTGAQRRASCLAVTEERSDLLVASELE